MSRIKNDVIHKMNIATPMIRDFGVKIPFGTRIPLPLPFFVFRTFSTFSHSFLFVSLAFSRGLVSQRLIVNFLLRPRPLIVQIPLNYAFLIGKAAVTVSHIPSISRDLRLSLTAIEPELGTFVRVHHQVLNLGSRNHQNGLKPEVGDALLHAKSSKLRILRAPPATKLTLAAFARCHHNILRSSTCLR